MAGATDKQIRAGRAREVLENEVFQEAFDQVELGIRDAIVDAPIADADLRNQLGLQLGAAAALKQQLFDVINDARLEAEQARRGGNEEDSEA